VLLTTHYMDEAEKLCDRIGVVDHGKLIALDTPAALIRSLGGEEIVDFAADGELSLEGLAGVDGVVSARKEADGFVLTTQTLHQTLPALFAHIEGNGACLRRLSTHRATLEDVFVHLTGKSLRE
jgi:ABC-2 type transport system ATP-binding protein